MNRLPGKSTGILAAALCLQGLLWGAAPGAAAAAVRSVEELNADKNQWSSYATAGTPMAIEGRLSTISGHRLRFRNCELPFQSHDGKSLVKPIAHLSNVEVSGKFGLVNTKPTFLIERFRETPSDADVYRQREKDLRDAKPADWYALGDWVAKRSAFYDDAELRSRARDAYRQAIERERKALPADEIDALVSLSAKIPTYGLPDSLRGELVHEAWQRRWNQVAKDNTAALRGLAEAMAKELPGCTTPLEPAQAKLGAEYLRSPLKVYQTADEATRKRLHRVLYAELMRIAILLRAQPDGGNGSEIAAEFDALGPEFRSLGESYREKELELRISRVQNATRQEVIQLADELRQKKRAEKAREILEVWLKSREERLRKDGPTGLVQAADDYESLLDDRNTATKLLVEAYEIDHSSQEIARRLKQLGYQLKEGRWLSQTDAQAVPADPIQAALREGRVVAGMTSEQVRKALGAPDAVTRIASSNEVNELWAYNNAGKTRLVVHIQRRGNGEARTLSISQVKTSAR